MNHPPFLRLSRRSGALAPWSRAAAAAVICGALGGALGNGLAAEAPGTAGVAVGPTLKQTAATSPVLRIRAEGAFDAPEARVGDTVTFRVRVTWNDVPAAVMLSPREVLEAPGFSPAGRAVVHSRAAGLDRSEGVTRGAVNSTEFIYALVPLEPGTARVMPLTVRYLDGLTGREEELTVPGAALIVTPAGMTLFGWSGRSLGVATALAGATGLAALAATTALRKARRRSDRAGRIAASRGSANPPEAALAPTQADPEGLRELRARVDGADGRVWVRDAERLCIDWLCGRVGIAHPEHVRFEAALDQYLGHAPGLSSASAHAWTTLRDSFHEARYGAWRPEPHERLEMCRLMRDCFTKNHPTPRVGTTA